MELMVAITILVLIILGVNLVFQGAANTVGTSQALMGMTANVRAVQQLLESDVSGMDKNCFLVIRSTKENPNDRFARRFDQISFISSGSFPNRTGNSVNAVGAFTDNYTLANAALIWWGQLVLEQQGAQVGSTYLLPDQTRRLPLNQLPTGAISAITGLGSGTDVENVFALGRRTILLLPGRPANAPPNSYINPSGIYVPAYTSIDYTKAAPVIALTGETAADITSARISCAAVTPSQVIQTLTYEKVQLAAANNSDPLYEARRFCFRSHVPATIYDSELPPANNPLVNAYFRMHPIAMQGVSSFQIEWSNGMTDTVPNSPTFGQLIWYGAAPNPGGPGFGPNGTNAYANVEHYNPNNPRLPMGGGNGDYYVAQWSVDTPRYLWPKALRFTYHLVDPQNRLKNGRDFVQVVQLPN